MPINADMPCHCPHTHVCAAAGVGVERCVVHSLRGAERLDGWDGQCCTLVGRQLAAYSPLRLLYVRLRQPGHDTCMRCVGRGATALGTPNHKHARPARTTRSQLDSRRDNSRKRLRLFGLVSRPTLV